MVSADCILKENLGITPNGRKPVLAKLCGIIEPAYVSCWSQRIGSKIYVSKSPKLWEAENSANMLKIQKAQIKPQDIKPPIAHSAGGFLIPCK